MADMTERQRLLEEISKILGPNDMAIFSKLLITVATKAAEEERAACAEVARTITAYRRPTVEPTSGPRRSGPGSILAETIAKAIEARSTDHEGGGG